MFLFNKIVSKAGQTDFIKLSLAEEDSVFNYKNWLGINIDTLILYFGSKIAIYFTYLQNYLKMLMFIGFFIWFLDWIRGAYEGSLGDIGAAIEGNILILMCYLIMVWSFVFAEQWKLEERRYSVKYGQEKYLLVDKERTNFKSRYIRDITNSNPNSLEDQPKKRKCTMIISLVISLIIIIMSVISVFLMLYFRFAMA